MGSEHEESPVILIVEDEQGLADLYELWLGDSYDVRTAYDGEEALTLLDETVTVVLLDRRMPGLHGDEVLARIRDDDFDCCVVMMSAIEPDFDVIDMGFEEYLSKPVSKDSVQETVARMVELATYDPEIREYCVLISKKATLDAVMSMSDLKANDEYATLKAAINDRHDQLDGELTDSMKGEF